MSCRTNYYPGGFEADAPQHNVSELWDLTAGTYTHWDTDGSVLQSRPLTGDESAQLAAIQAGQTAAASIATIYDLTQQALTDNDTYLGLAAPSSDEQTAQLRRLTRQVQALMRYLSTVVQQPVPSNNLTDVTDITTP